MEKEYAPELETILARKTDQIDDDVLHFDSVAEVEKSTFLVYRMEILDFYMELFGLNLFFDNNIVLGGLAAKKISDAVLNNKNDDIPAIIKNYRKQFTDESLMNSLESIKTDYSIKYLIINNILVKHINDSKIIQYISDLHDGGKLVKERYIKGKENFGRCFEGREYFLRNIISNVFLDAFISENLTKSSFLDFYMYFCFCAAAVQIIAYAVGFSGENIEKDFKKTISSFFRDTMHNEKRANKIIDSLKNIGLTSPTHLALIIK